MYQEAISSIVDEMQAVMLDLNKLLKNHLATPEHNKQQAVKLENELDIAISNLVTIKMKIDTLSISFVKDMVNIPEDSFNQFLKLMAELSAIAEKQILEKMEYQSRVQEMIHYIQQADLD